MKIKKSDNIEVISGKDRGKTGKVLTAFPKRNQVLIEGINIKKKHQRPTKANQRGQIIEKAYPIHVSNVMIVDPKTSKPTRVRMDIRSGGKVRIAVKSGTVVT
jgi:large subunit ribosomal protein L24